MRCLIILLLWSLNLCGQKNINIDLKETNDLYERGKVAYYDGFYKKAIVLFDSCLAIRESILDRPNHLIAKAETRLGKAYMRGKQFDKGEDLLKKAVDHHAILFGDNSSEVAEVMMDLANLYGYKGYLSKATLWNEKAMAIQAKIYGPKSKEVTFIRMNEAINLYDRGQYSKCLEEFYEILENFNETLEDHHENYNRVYLTMSNAYRKKGDQTNALLAAEKALEIKLKNYPKEHRSVSKYYDNIAKVLVEMEEFSKAEQFFDKSIDIVRKHRSRRSLSSALNDAARVYQGAGACDKALAQLEEAMSLTEPQSRGYFNVMYNQALCKFEMGQKEEAYEMIRKVVEAQPDAQNCLRLSKFAWDIGLAREAKQYYELGLTHLSPENEKKKIDYLVHKARITREQDLDESWETIEKAIEAFVTMRRSFSGEDSRSYVNSELEQVFDLAVDLAYERYSSDPALFEPLYRVIEQAKAAAFWDNASEQNASFYGGVPIDLLEEIAFLQEQGIESKTALERKLSYLEEHYPDYFQRKYSLDVPALGSVIASLEDDLMLIDYYVLDDEEIIALLIDKNQQQVLRFEREENVSFQKELAGVSDNISRITIIPHEHLFYISFDQIEHPEKGSYLLFDYAFSYQVNVQSLLESGREEPSLAYLGMVPNWEVKSTTGTNIDRNFLVPLPGAKDEVAKVAKVLKGRVLQGAQATESAFYESAHEYGILHFATHAKIDPKNELNSMLFLQREGERDQALELDEIMETKLNADLVILSACETGAGGLKSGEGVMSLARAFQYAGAKSVLMSLWRANDQSAQPIVLEFVKNYKAGMPKDVALQQSKIAYLKEADPLLKSEFYWAGFMLNGQLNPYPVASFPLSYWIIGIIGLIVVFLLFRFA